MEVKFKTQDDFFIALANGAHLKHEKTGIIVYFSMFRGPEHLIKRALRKAGNLSPTMEDVMSIYKDQWELFVPKVPNVKQVKELVDDGFKYIATCCQDAKVQMAFENEPEMGPNGWVANGRTREVGTIQDGAADWKWSLVAIG